MKNLLAILIVLIVTLTGCSYRTVIRIVNLTNNPVHIEYTLKKTTNYADFNLDSKVYKLKDKIDTDYNKVISKTTYNEKLQTASVVLDTQQVLVLAEIHGFYDEQYSKSENFNIKSIKIKSEDGELVSTGNMIFSFFNKIDDYSYGIIIK